MEKGNEKPFRSFTIFKLYNHAQLRPIWADRSKQLLPNRRENREATWTIERIERHEKDGRICIEIEKTMKIVVRIQRSKSFFCLRVHNIVSFYGEDNAEMENMRMCHDVLYVDTIVPMNR